MYLRGRRAIRRTLIGLRHSTPLLDRLAGCGQWQGAHAPGGRAAIGHHEKEHPVALVLPVELESFGRGWLGVGFQAPYRRHTYYLPTCCLPGTYVDWLRIAVTRVPLDRFVYLYARRQKVVAVWLPKLRYLLYRGPRRLGLGDKGECRVRLPSTPSASPQRQHSKQRSRGRQTERARACHGPPSHKVTPSAIFLLPADDTYCLITVLPRYASVIQPVCDPGARVLCLRYRAPGAQDTPNNPNAGEKQSWGPMLSVLMMPFKLGTYIQ